MKCPKCELRNQGNKRKVVVNGKRTNKAEYWCRNCWEVTWKQEVSDENN